MRGDKPTRIWDILREPQKVVQRGETESVLVCVLGCENGVNGHGGYCPSLCPPLIDIVPLCGDVQCIRTSVV